MTADIANRLNMTGQQSKKDLESAIKSSFQNLLETNKARKRSYGDSPGRDSATSERRNFGCKWCHKSKKTQCDLKYTPLAYPLLYENDDTYYLLMCAGNMRSDTPAPTAAPIQDVPADSVAKMTGSAMRIRSTGRSRHGNVASRERKPRMVSKLPILNAKPRTNAAESSTVENYSRLTWRMTEKLTTTSRM
jgi:hypothetical protein